MICGVGGRLLPGVRSPVIKRTEDRSLSYYTLTTLQLGKIYIIYYQIVLSLGIINLVK